MSDDPDFYRRLAEHREENENGIWARRDYVNESPAIGGGSEARGPWRLRKFGHVNVCRSPAAQTTLADSLRADVDDALIKRVVLKFNQRLRNGRYNEHARLVVQCSPDGSWVVRVDGVKPRSVGVETMMTLSAVSFPTADDAVAWLVALDHWIVRIDTEDA